MWTSKDMYLKQVDKVNDVIISAFVTPSSNKFYLIHAMCVCVNRNEITAPA